MWKMAVVRRGVSEEGVSEGSDGHGVYRGEEGCGECAVYKEVRIL